MQVQFKPTDTLPTYTGRVKGNPSEMVEALTAGVYDWPEEKVKQVCADFPENFKEVKAEQVKSVVAPTHDRSAHKPTRDK